MYNPKYPSKGYLILKHMYNLMSKHYDEIHKEYEIIAQQTLNSENELSIEELDELKTLIKQTTETKDDFESDSLLHAMKVGVPLKAQVEFLEEDEATHIPVSLLFHERSCKSEEEFELIKQALFTEQQDIETRVEILSNFFGSRLDISVLEDKHPIQHFHISSIQSDREYSSWGIAYYITIKGKLKQQYCQQLLSQLKTFVCSLEREQDVVQNYIYTVADASDHFRNILKKIEEIKNQVQLRSYQEQ